jgi:hypothetical protein
MTIIIEIHCDFMEIPSVIPLDENCPKCAAYLNGRCVRYGGRQANQCGFGRKGYFALRKLEERIEDKEA